MSVSLPKTFTLPDKPYYPVTDLNNFDLFTRASYLARFGVQAPPFDPVRRIKRWFDSLDFGLNFSVTYLYWDARAAAFLTLTMESAEASVPNLPGAYTYPPYVPSPTTALVIHTAVGDSSVVPFEVSLLISLEEATQLATEIASATQIAFAMPVEGEFIGQFTINWNGETRRNWMIPWAGTHQQASALLAAKNKHGVGAPGYWDTSALKLGPRFVFSTPDIGLNDTRPEVPVPVRSLYPEEALTTETWVPYIYRTDMPSVFNRHA